MLPARLAVISKNNPKKPYYNPSLCWHNGKLMISIRSSTWTRDEHGYKATILDSLHTDVILGEVDPTTLEVSKLQTLKYVNPHPFVKNIGLEDARLFVRDNEIHVVGTCMSKEDRCGETVHIAHGIIRGKELVFKGLLTKPHPERIEKNWAPPEKPNDKFDFIYSPTQTIKDGVLSGEPEYHGRVHGGSQVVEWEGGYLSFVHKIHKLQHTWDGFFQYINYAMKYDENGIATHISQGFLLFADNNIEFVSGLVKMPSGKLLISLGVGDRYSALAEIDPDDLHFTEFDHKQEPIRIYLQTAEGTVSRLGEGTL